MNVKLETINNIFFSSMIEHIATTGKGTENNATTIVNEKFRALRQRSPNRRL